MTTKQNDSLLIGKKLVKRYLARSEIGAIIMFVVLIIGFELYSGYFLRIDNMAVIMNILPELGIVALGVAILMISGEFDLSVGAVFAMAPMVTCILAANGIEIWTSMIFALALAVAFGFINATLTLKFRIPSFVTTLGMMFVIRSLTVVISGGFPPPFPEDAPVELFTGELGPIRASLLWFVLLAIVTSFLMKMTNLGSWIFATGGDEVASKNMGINTNRVKTFSFMLCSLFAGFAGILQTYRMGAALPTLGTGLELEAIAAAVIGGIALTGGVGSVLGAVLGALLIKSIDSKKLKYQLASPHDH